MIHTYSTLPHNKMKSASALGSLCFLKKSGYRHKSLFLTERSFSTSISQGGSGGEQSITEYAFDIASPHTLVSPRGGSLNTGNRLVCWGVRRGESFERVNGPERKRETVGATEVGERQRCLVWIPTCSVCVCGARMPCGLVCLNFHISSTVCGLSTMPVCLERWITICTVLAVCVHTRFT